MVALSLIASIAVTISLALNTQLELHEFQCSFGMVTLLVVPQTAVYKPLAVSSDRASLGNVHDEFRG
jgi:hypothetical protein